MSEEQAKGVGRRPRVRPMPIESVGLGIKMKAARYAAGYTLGEIARLVGVNVSTVALYESGQYTVKLHTALRIMALLDMPMSDIDHSYIDDMLKRAEAL